jgi:hypothetical protein
VLGSTRYLAYASYNDRGASFEKIIVLNTFMCILLFLFDEKMNDKIKTMYFFTVLSTAIVTTFSSVGAITRFSYFFKIFEIILIADIIYFFKNKDIRLFIIVFIIFGYYGVMFFNALLVDVKIELFPKIVPYKIFLNI